MDGVDHLLRLGCLLELRERLSFTSKEKIAKWDIYLS